jgi:hypothetical protein
VRSTRRSYANVTSTVALVIALGGGTAIAVQQINADKVDGLNAAKLDFTVRGKPNAEAKWKTVLSQGGLVIRARCVEESGYALGTRVKTKVNNAELQAVAGSNPATPDTEVLIEREFDKDEQPALPLSQGQQGQGTLVYSTPAGSHVSVVFQADVGGSIMGGETTCLIGGTALHAPG